LATTTGEQPPPSLKPGTRLLGYQVLGLLAQGGMAEVYLARKPSGPPVVIKRIRPNLVEDPQFVRMFVDEARLAQMLNHPHVVKVLEVGQDNSIYALAMEFLDGRNLLRVARACYQRRAYVPYELMGRIMADSLTGLDHAHHQKGPDGQPLNMVHRDMSPENIVITYDGRVKVVDFGIAKAANMEGRTQAGVIKGKLGYVAPEAISGEKLDARADIFAMGVTLYELLTYTVPFAGNNEVEILTAISTRDPQSPRALNPSVPVPLEEICMRALEKNRQRRWQSASDMRNALENFVRSTGKGTTPAHLGVFMETLFPKGTDKDRVRVAELLEAPLDDASEGATRITPHSPASRGTPAAANRTVNPAVQRTPAKGTPPNAPQSGPSWSKALQIEAMMGPGGSPNVSVPPQSAPAAPSRPKAPQVDLKTDALELSIEEMDDLRGSSGLKEVNTGEVMGFEEPVDDGATRVEDNAALQEALRASLADTALDQKTVRGPPTRKVAAPFQDPVVTASPVAPAHDATLRGPPPSPAPVPRTNAANLAAPLKKGRSLPVEAPLAAAPASSVRTVVAPPPTAPAPPPMPLDISAPDLEAISDAPPPPPLDVSDEIALPPPTMAVSRPLQTQESDVLIPPEQPRARGMHPVVAFTLGMFVAALLSGGAVAAGLVVGVLRPPPMFEQEIKDLLGAFNSGNVVVPVTQEAAAAAEPAPPAQP